MNSEQKALKRTHPSADCVCDTKQSISRADASANKSLNIERAKLCYKITQLSIPGDLVFSFQIERVQAI